MAEEELRAARRRRILENSASRLEALQATMKDALATPTPPPKKDAVVVLPPLPPSPVSEPEEEPEPPKIIPEVAPPLAAVPAAAPAAAPAEAVSVDLDAAAGWAGSAIVFLSEPTSLIRITLLLVFLYAGVLWNGCVTGGDTAVCPPSFFQGVPLPLITAVAIEHTLALRALVALTKIRSLGGAIACVAPLWTAGSQIAIWVAYMLFWLVVGYGTAGVCA